ncbi:MAG: AAA family ATPase [Gammaproteobacteria bacterium]|nr:AAA family ATPase [Gammaproteobacteria bacterium]
MGLDRIRVRNYRALADVDIAVGSINILFGPNGSGKSTLLDTVYFFRDCAIRGVELASSQRDHGIGMLWDGSGKDEPIRVELAAGGVAYGLSFSLTAGRIDPFPGEQLVASGLDLPLIERAPGSTKASLYHKKVEQATIELREPEKISLGLFLDFSRDEEAARLDSLLHFVRFYHSRSFHLWTLKRSGSESSHQTRLWDSGKNAWSVLRNVQDKRNLDARYSTIMDYMAEAFPAFDGIVLEQTGPSSVYASFQEKGLGEPIFASGISDGVLQMLLLLIALFSEGDREAVLLFDEPEVSLHPWAISVLARAIKHASAQWSKQVFIATHSPVLISQFEPRDILAAQTERGRARFDRLSEIEEVQELLKEYAPGSLYMSQAIAPQGRSAATQVMDG